MHDAKPNTLNPMFAKALARHKLQGDVMMGHVAVILG
jgi:hypothetical protein